VSFSRLADVLKGGGGSTSLEGALSGIGTIGVATSEGMATRLGAGGGGEGAVGIGDLGTADALFEDARRKSDRQILNITKMLDLGAMRSGRTAQFVRSLEAAKEGLRGLLKQNPHSNLQVLIVPHSHADLSWPDTPEVCTNINVQAIAKSIAILEKSPDFKFSEEDVFVLQEFLRRYPEQEETVRDLLRRNILSAHPDSFRQPL
jgi:hypothetical protein